MDVRNNILELWTQIEQDPSQIDLFLKWLQESDFFIAPCSTKFHLARKGGLAEHSLHVYMLLRQKIERYELDISESSIIICGLGHDLCKVNFYKVDEEDPTPAQSKYFRDIATLKEKDLCEVQGGLTKAWASKLIDWIKNGRKGDMPSRDEAYTVDDKFPMGHGEKSVSILQDFFHLTEEEKLAIRWHMAAFDASIHFDYPNGFPFRSAAEIPLVTLLFTADYEASQIIEREVKDGE